MSSSEVASVVVTVLGAILAVVAQLYERLRERKKKEETIEDRINTLTTSLRDASRIVSQVEEEIADRQQLVQRLQKDAETYNKVASLNKGDVEAVAQVLRGELKKDDRRKLFRDILLNFVFFMLGLAASFFLLRR